MTPFSRILFPFFMAGILLLLSGCESVSSTSRHPKTEPKKIVKAVALPSRADRVVIEKSKRTLTAYSGKHVVASFRVALGRDPVGPKRCKGDYRTPEGHYKVIGRNPLSNYYRSLMLDYPNATDIANARKQGCHPGSNIVIHGLENGYDWVGRTHCSVDWTSGCVAVTNQEMDRLWQLIPIGTPVEIRS
jgi:murein L,D-transpeptidase YafK